MLRQTLNHITEDLLNQQHEEERRQLEKWRTDMVAILRQLDADDPIIFHPNDIAEMDGIFFSLRTNYPHDLFIISYCPTCQKQLSQRIGTTLNGAIEEEHIPYMLRKIAKAVNTPPEHACAS